MLFSKIKHLKAFGSRLSSSHYVTTPIFYVNAGAFGAFVVIQLLIELFT